MWHESLLHFFLFIIFHWYTTVCLSVHQLMDFGVVSIRWLSWIVANLGNVVWNLHNGVIGVSAFLPCLKYSFHLKNGSWLKKVTCSSWLCHLKKNFCNTGLRSLRTSSNLLWNWSPRHGTGREEVSVFWVTHALCYLGVGWVQTGVSYVSNPINSCCSYQDLIYFIDYFSICFTSLGKFPESLYNLLFIIFY